MQALCRYATALKLHLFFSNPDNSAPLTAIDQAAFLSKIWNDTLPLSEGRELKWRTHGDELVLLAAQGMMTQFKRSGQSGTLRIFLEEALF